jgi:hypothetical protein
MRYIVLLALALAPALAQTGSPAGSQSGTLTITGGSPARVTIQIADLAAMPRQTITLTEPDGSKDEYEGVAVIELLKKAGVPTGGKLRGKALTTYVLAKAHDGYAVLYSLAELDPDLANGRFIVADKRNGKALFDYQGPLRIVAGSDKPAARSLRMLEEIEVVQLSK